MERYHKYMPGLDSFNQNVNKKEKELKSRHAKVKHMEIGSAISAIHRNKPERDIFVNGL